jgi:hypothetical protein
MRRRLEYYWLGLRRNSWENRKVGLRRVKATRRIARVNYGMVMSSLYVF